VFRLFLQNLLVLRIYSLSFILYGTTEISLPSRTTSLLRSESQMHRLSCALVDTLRRSLHLRRSAIFRLQAHMRSTGHLIWINRSSFGCGSTGASFLRVTCSITMVADLTYSQVPALSWSLGSSNRRDIIRCSVPSATFNLMVDLLHVTLPSGEGQRRPYARCDHALTIRRLDFWSGPMVRLVHVTVLDESKVSPPGVFPIYPCRVLHILPHSSDLLRSLPRPVQAETSDPQPDEASLRIHVSCGPVNKDLIK
jgi:hypothetical protein